MMAHTIPCTATDSKTRLKIAKAQAPESLLGEPFDNAMVADDLCRQIHSHRRIKNRPIPSGDMPVLFITGDLDDRTPIGLAESASKGFVHSRQVIVGNGGHELLPEEQVQRMVANFFAGKEGADAKISFPRRTFSSITEAAQPPRHPSR